MDSLKLFEFKIYLNTQHEQSNIFLKTMFIGKRLQINDCKSKHNPHEVLSDLRFWLTNCKTAEQPCVC